MRRIGPDVWDDEDEQELASLRDANDYEPIRKIGDQVLVEDEKLNELQRMADEANSKYYVDDGSRYGGIDDETREIISKLTKVKETPVVDKKSIIKKMAATPRLKERLNDVYGGMTSNVNMSKEFNPFLTAISPNKTYVPMESQGIPMKTNSSDGIGLGGGLALGAGAAGLGYGAYKLGQNIGNRMFNNDLPPIYPADQILEMDRRPQLELKPKQIDVTPDRPQLADLRRNATDFQYINPKAQPIVENILYKRGLPDVIKGDVLEAELNALKPDFDVTKSSEPLIFKNPESVKYPTVSQIKNKEGRVGGVRPMTLSDPSLKRGPGSPSVLNDMNGPGRIDFNQKKMTPSEQKIVNNLNLVPTQTTDVPYRFIPKETGDVMENIIAENQLRGLENGLKNRPLRSTVTGRLTKSLKPVVNMFTGNAGKIGLGIGGGLLSLGAMAAEEGFDAEGLGHANELDAIKLMKITGMSYEESLMALAKEKEYMAKQAEMESQKEAIKAIVADKFRNKIQY